VPKAWTYTKHEHDAHIASPQFKLKGTRGREYDGSDLMDRKLRVRSLAVTSASKVLGIFKGTSNLPWPHERVSSGVCASPGNEAYYILWKWDVF
jgi:hypothetical protein